MPDLSENPFTTGRMVLREENFVGRSREIANITARLHTYNSVSVVGERRIGKSSLLYHLHQTGARRLDRRGQWVYLSFHEPELKSQTGFSESLLEELGCAYDNAEMEKKPLVVLSTALNQLTREDWVPSLLLDEFEDVTQSKDLFTDDFFETLRSFCNDGRLTLVTASMHTLRWLTDQGNLTSPFWNLFSQVSLGEYIMDAQLDEPHDFRQHFWGPHRLNGTAEEWKWLYAFHDTHPLVLQVVSDRILRNRVDGYSQAKLAAYIRQDLESFFRSKPEELAKWTKDRLKKLGKVTTHTSQFVGENLRNLSPLTSLLGK